MKKVASSKSPQQAQPSVEQLSIFTLLEQLQSETKPGYMRSQIKLNHL